MEANEPSTARKWISSSSAVATSGGVEAKASHNVGVGDLRGLRAFADYCDKPQVSMVLYMGNVRRRMAGTDVLPWQEGSREIGI